MDETQAKKLEKFNESVNAEVEEHIGKMMDEVKKASMESLKKAEDDALLEAYNKIQKAVKDIEAEYRKNYALEEQKFRMESLRHREELSQRIFDHVEKKLIDFVSSEKYGDYLMRTAEGEKLLENSVVAVSARDMKYGEKIKEKYGCQIKADESIEIGGLMFIVPELGMMIDKTFDSALEEQKKTFSSRYSFNTNSKNNNR